METEQSGWKAIPQDGSIGNHRMGHTSHIRIPMLCFSFTCLHSLDNFPISFHDVLCRLDLKRTAGVSPGWQMLPRPRVCASRTTAENLLKWPCWLDPAHPALPQVDIVEPHSPSCFACTNFPFSLFIRFQGFDRTNCPQTPLRP